MFLSVHFVTGAKAKEADKETVSAKTDEASA